MREKRVSWDILSAECSRKCERDDSVGDLGVEVGLSGELHLDQDHGGDLLRGEVLDHALILDVDVRLVLLADDLEGEVLHVGLDRGISETTTDEALGVEDGVLRVVGSLKLGGTSDETA